MLPSLRDASRIERSRLGAAASSLGAAVLVMDEFFADAEALEDAGIIGDR